MKRRDVESVVDDDIELQPTQPDRRSRNTRQAPMLVAAAVVVALLAAGAIVWSQTRGSDETGVRTVGRDQPSDPGAEDADDPAADEASTGMIRIRLEEVGGHFIEGFEVGLRIETGDGTLIHSTLWSDFVATIGSQDIDAFYDSVLEQSVPAGPIVVLAEANVGMGPGPSIPDVTGPLPCRVELDVAAGATELLEVSFDGPTDCIRRIDPDAPPTTTTSAPPPPPTTIPTPETVVAGSSWYIDVDLDCRAFDLAGTWALDEGDLSTWQPAGERHEGGMFTLDAADHGTFVGDAQGVKTATFRRLPAGESPPCMPIPR